MTHLYHIRELEDGGVSESEEDSVNEGREDGLCMRDIYVQYNSYGDTQ